MASPLLSSRRHFLYTAGGAIAASTLAPLRAAPTTAQDPLAGRLLKTLKIGMVKVEGDLTAKFTAAKAAGFNGIELNAPGFDIDEAKQAVAATGLPIDGTVCGSHWKIRHTSPDAATRAQALTDLQQALRDTAAVGGHTVLLVAGKGEDGPEEEIWPRAVENISKALPLAAELGVAIAIENVWNQLHYDHDGDSNQSAEKFVRFIDDFNSPWVGMQFDIGNHWKYGSMGDWIRQLGKRVIKLDVKGFSRATGKFTEIGEGDIDFDDVRKALVEINYHGWVAAEVGGGDLAKLTTIAQQMDRVFGL